MYYKFKEKHYGSSGASSGLTSSLAFTLVQVHIVQRGAIQPLIEMLKSPYAQLGEMSAFVLGRLAQDKHNQAGIAHSGGIVPLLRLIDSRNGAFQHNSTYSYGIFKS
nr:armadillo btb protein 1 [Quercus suber]